MCTTNVYTYVYPDGHRETLHQPTLCPASRHGQTCMANMFFQHPPQYVSGTSAPYQMPPTPNYTPRSSTPNYRSGDESDRSGSRRSNNSARKSPRASGVYINGTKVYDLGNPHRDRRSSSSRRERIVLVDNPPTPRTPPQLFPGAASAPNSPSFPPFVSEGGQRDSHYQSASRRPVIVDERIRPEPRASTSRHSRQTSASSRESRFSEDEEQRAARRQRRREQREREEKEVREAKISDRIAKANARIAQRPTVPVAPAPPPRRESTFDTTTTGATAGSAPSSPKKSYVRPHVEVHSNKDAELAEAVRRLSFEEQVREEKAQRIAERDRKREEKAKFEEEEAQRRRLMERMMPKRRATVGPGSRRQRVLYDDGVYRWE